LKSFQTKEEAVMDEWVIEEMGAADLKDKRLDVRLKELLTQLGRQPVASIPQACGGHAEMIGAYRFFDNDKATFAAILSPHTKKTLERIAAQPTVLAVQDTTEIDLTRPEQQVKGAGPLDKGARQGLLLHPLHAFTPDGTPLGTIDAMCWTRDPSKPPSTRAIRASTPIECKESFRWVQAHRMAAEAAKQCPNTRLVSIGDSEADIYELLAEPTGADWIVRACYNRVVESSDKGPDCTTDLRQRLFERPVSYCEQIPVRGRKLHYSCDKRTRRQPRISRQAAVEVRAATLTLRPPRRHDRILPPVTINAVLVLELNPPADEAPVEWLLLTSLPVDDIEQIRAVVSYYSVRWMIEVFFRVIKSGCRIEKRRFESIERVYSCLAVYLIIAWRTLYVCRLARSCPDIDCEVIFEPAEWKSVWKVVKRVDPPSQPPTLGVFVPLLARLGGYVEKKNSPPGPQTVWIGLQRACDFALCWKMFGPEAKGDVNV
jgi:hypothetical protein